MAETTAYFEAYCPVLEGLQEIRANISLQKYFIFTQEKLQPPKYLLGDIRKYDLSSLTKSRHPVMVPILNTSSWPQLETMILNESQREAVQLALTKELAIIQGPPGTGKTYVGLKVMKVLLENQAIRAGNEESLDCHDPILVVCYTNHALDQFLEGVITFCPEGVVRVGGKSSSKVMEDLNLKNLKRHQTLQRSVKTALWKSSTDIRSIAHTIKELNTQMERTHIGILNQKTLENYILPKHSKSLMTQDHPYFKSNDQWMKYWLNSFNGLNIDNLPQRIKRHLTKLILQVREHSFIQANNASKNKMKASLQAMSIIERARVYQGWLHQFRCRLNLSFRQDFSLLKESNDRILPDPEIRNVIPDQIFNCIYSLHHSLDSSNAIEFWVLCLGSSLNVQLDNIENLQNYFSQNGNQVDDFDDVEGAVESQNARQIDFDPEEQEMLAKATANVVQDHTYLLLKAERLGLNNEDDKEIENDDDRWQTVRHRKPLTFSKIRHNLTNIRPMTEKEEESVDDLWTLDIRKRFALYNLWMQRYRNGLAVQIEEMVDEYREALSGKKEIKMESDLDILKRAKVIGMTTTGAAKYRKLLQAVACRIIVVEEAAEVLEAHIITALNENCRHLILIGDHQQLRPNPTVYALAKDYHLDLSLFERLINNGIQHVTLKEQHRMRQSISKIMRHIYPNLQDHISVTKYDNVRGVANNIYFINHEKFESEVSDSKSKSNAHEASFIIALLTYFLQQGYETSQITILATYVGQTLMLKKELNDKKIGLGVRVTTVDNYQGEENDIILLSLVRSNAQSIAGFLKIDNRVCVALSRAKKGLFAIGNFKMLSSQSKLWEKIVQTAEDDNIIGYSLPAVCPNHPSIRVEISSPDDFKQKCPEGGCGCPCEYRLNCGHTCPLQCHGYDNKHEKVKCNKQCVKKCPEGHPCRKICVQECGNCTEVVEKIIPRCGHINKIPCHVKSQNAVCSQPCGVLLGCQHPCTGKCGECYKNMKHGKCLKLVEYFWPCDHIVKVPCYMKPSEYSCPEKCQATLQCGHKCTGTCSECLEGALHIACEKVCSKILPCGHQCFSPCGIPCPPCSKMCSNSCRHSKCNVKGHICGGKCIPCQEPCLNKCIHLTCGNKCHEECDIEPCQERCHKRIKKCNHPCSGLCGELCVCVQCDSVSTIPNTRSDDIKKGPVSQENEKAEKSVLAGDALLIKIPSCGHIFHVNDLDIYISLEARKQKYQLPCPICKMTIQKCFHYNKVIKTKYLEMERAKMKIRRQNDITDHQKNNIVRSQEILKKVDSAGIWKNITKRSASDLIKGHEVVSLSYIYKYAYVLNDLDLLQRKSSFDEPLTTKRIQAVLKLGLTRTVTQNQISDFQVELKRLLLYIYLNRLEELCDKVSYDEVKTDLKVKKDRLKAKDCSLDFLKKMMSSITVLVMKLPEKLDVATSQAKLLVTRKMMARDWNILDSNEDKMLCDFVST